MKNLHTTLTTLALFILLASSGCESDSAPMSQDNKKVKAPTTSIENVQLSDTTQPDSVKLKEEPNSTKVKSPEKKDLKPKEMPIDDGSYENVMDDPNYIGTPCEMVNGECIRHNHSNNQILNELDDL